MRVRADFIDEQPALDPMKLVFLDEAGIDVAMARSCGWAPVGETPVVERPAKGKRLSLIGAIAADGPRALRVVDGFVNGDVFLTFLRDDLGPTLSPGDIVVMDGPSIHKVAGVAPLLESFGATALYLPAYSPELNPIEMTWAWLKNLLRACPPRKLAQLRERAVDLWGGITSALCRGWVSHCGYVAST